MIEDRTSSFLYYIGFTSEKNRSSAAVTRKIKKEIREILKMEQQDTKYKFHTLFGKLTRIEELMEWCKKDNEATTDYQKALIKALRPVANLSDFENILNYLKAEWCRKRNQLVHSLFNKKPQIVVSELKPLIEKGYNAARILDKSVTQLKKAKIRERFKLQ